MGFSFSDPGIVSVHFLQCSIREGHRRRSGNKSRNMRVRVCENTQTRQ